MGKSYLFYLFMAYLTTLSVDQTVWRHLIGRLINNELEIMRKEGFVAYFRYDLDICQEGLRKSMKSQLR